MREGLKAVRWLRELPYQRVVSAAVLIGFSLALIPGISPFSNKKAGAGGSIVFKDATSTFTNNGNTLALTTPSGVIENDVMIATVSFIGNFSVNSVPSGWTLVGSANQSTNLAVRAYWKKAGASETGPYNFGLNGSTQIAGGVASYRGAHTTSPIGTVGTSNSAVVTGSNVSATANAITAGNTNSKIIGVFASAEDAGRSFTPSSDRKERFDIASSRPGVGNIDATTQLTDIAFAGTSVGASSSVVTQTDRWAAFQFELKNDGVIHMLLFWDGTNYLGGGLSVPSGWSIVDDYDGRFVRGDSAANFGAVGGSSTHSATTSSVVVNQGNGTTGASGDQATVAAATHQHTASVTASTVSSEPQFRTLRLIRYDTGVPNVLPAGGIAIFDNSPGIPTSPAPGSGSGWTHQTAFNSRFVKIDATPNANGGNNDNVHVHNLTWSDLSASTGTAVRGGSFFFDTNSIAGGHTHTAPASTTTATNNTDPCDVAPVANQCLPPYVQALLAKAESNTPTISVGFSAMFDGNPGGGWVTRSDPDPDGGGPAVAGPFYQRYITGGATYDEDDPGNPDDNGATTHQHAAATSGASAVSGSPSAGNVLVGFTVSPQNHTHTVTANFNASNNDPQYFNVVVGEKVNFILQDYWWYEDNDALTPTARWGTPDLAAHSQIVALPIASADPPDLGRELRLRIQILINGNDLAANSVRFKIQYNTTNSTTCTASSGTWTDIGESTDTDKAWRYATSSVAEQQLASSVFTPASTVMGNYVKSIAGSLNNPSATIGNTVEYDFHIEHYQAEGGTQYSFRILETTGTLLSQYDYCPTLITRPRTENQLRHGNFFLTDNAGDASTVLEQGFSWVD